MQQRRENLFLVLPHHHFLPSAHNPKIMLDKVFVFVVTSVAAELNML